MFKSWLNKKSIKTKISVIIVSIVFISITIFGLFVTLMISEEVKQKTYHQLEKLCKEIDLRITSHAKIAQMLSKIGESAGINLEKGHYSSLLVKLASTNQDTYGVGIWFEPYKYKKNMKYWGPYAYRDGDKLIYTEEYSTPSYNYLGWDWYKIGVNKKDTVVWSLPFYDPVSKLSMITANAPMNNQNGFIGIASADYSLNSLQKLVEKSKIGNNGWAFIIDKQGNYVAHSNTKKVMKEKILNDENKSLVDFGKKVLSEKKGNASFYDNNGKNLAFYTPILNTGMILTIVIPELSLYGLIIVKVLFGALLFIFVLNIVLNKIISKLIIDRIIPVLEQLKHIAQGDLMVEDINDAENDEIKELYDGLNLTVRSLRNIVQQVARSIEEISAGSQQMLASSDQTTLGSQQIAQSIATLATGSQQISDNISQLAHGTQQMSNNLEDGLNNINNLNKTIQTVSVEADTVSKLGNDAENNAMSGTKQVIKAVDKIKSIKNVSMEISVTIEKLGKLSFEIETILDLIKKISGQTNLLALNAAIEAARAGEHGKGFAVVAEEVKKLADQSGQATDKISSMIKEIQSITQIAVDTMDKGITEVEEGVIVVNDVGTALENIINQVKSANSKIQQITSEIDGIARNSDEVVKMVENISAVTEETATSAEGISDIIQKQTEELEDISSVTQEQTASLEEINTSSQMLTVITENLRKQVSVFKI